MQLIKSRPIPLPVERNGWYDDFAVTGANHPGYAYVEDVVKQIISGGITLSTTATRTWYKFYPAIRASNFKAECVVRPIIGSSHGFCFRCVRGENSYFLLGTSGTSIVLLRFLNGSGAPVGSADNLSFTGPVKLGVLALGSEISCYLNGIFLFKVVDTNLINADSFMLAGRNTSNIARAEYRYLAIQPL